MIRGSASRPWTEHQKTAASGFGSWRICARLASERTLAVTDPTNCPAVIPADLVYHPTAKPGGVRCDLFINGINAFGRDPRTGRAFRPLDNVGVQYGLVPFRGGVIDADQFIELNERIGGFDQDGRTVAPRSEADPEAVRLVYQRGLLVTGGGGLSEVPTIVWRPYTDGLGSQDGHPRYLSFVSRARLVAASGTAANQVMLVDRPEELYRWREGRFWHPIGDLVPLMDGWLDAIAADLRPVSAAVRVSENRPRSLAEGCVTVSGERIAERASYDGPGRCNALYPAYGDARIAAGAPVADDIVKCALKPVDRNDHARPLTDEQMSRLRAAFPTGSAISAGRGSASR